jgi:hypothetical protein
VLSLDEGLVRVVLGAEDREAVATSAGRIAVTGTDVPTLRGCQIKGTIRSVEPGDEEDRALLERYRAEVFADIQRTDGIPVTLLERITPDDVVGCVFAVEEVFDQTPGPGAGAAIRGET